MADFTITLNETELKALNFAGIENAEEHVQNFITNKARKAIDQIVSIYTTNALDAPHEIPGTRAEIVTDAFVKGYVKTVAAQNEEILAERE
tara:strand:+ start:2015 stop:2287 length:273 start_codon:yes stop_codon:yes gene_type:complete